MSDSSENSPTPPVITRSASPIPPMPSASPISIPGLTTISVMSTVSATSELSFNQSMQSMHKREILTCQLPMDVPQSFIVYKDVRDENNETELTKADIINEYRRKAAQLLKNIYSIRHVIANTKSISIIR